MDVNINTNLLPSNNTPPTSINNCYNIIESNIYTRYNHNFKDPFFTDDYLDNTDNRKNRELNFDLFETPQRKVYVFTNKKNTNFLVGFENGVITPVRYNPGVFSIANYNVIDNAISRSYGRRDLLDRGKTYIIILEYYNLAPTNDSGEGVYDDLLKYYTTTESFIYHDKTTSENEKITNCAIGKSARGKEKVLLHAEAGFNRIIYADSIETSGIQIGRRGPFNSNSEHTVDGTYTPPGIYRRAHFIPAEFVEIEGIVQMRHLNLYISNRDSKFISSKIRSAKRHRVISKDDIGVSVKVEVVNNNETSVSSPKEYFYLTPNKEIIPFLEEKKANCVNGVYISYYSNGKCIRKLGPLKEEELINYNISTDKSLLQRDIKNKVELELEDLKLKNARLVLDIEKLREERDLMVKRRFLNNTLIEIKKMEAEIDLKNSMMKYLYDLQYKILSNKAKIDNEIELSKLGLVEKALSMKIDIKNKIFKHKFERKSLEYKFIKEKIDKKSSNIDTIFSNSLKLMSLASK